jgi:hypothetical protein
VRGRRSIGRAVAKRRFIARPLRLAAACQDLASSGKRKQRSGLGLAGLTSLRLVCKSNTLFFLLCEAPAEIPIWRAGGALQQRGARAMPEPLCMTEPAAWAFGMEVRRMQHRNATHPRALVEPSRCTQTPLQACAGLVHAPHRTAPHRTALHCTARSRLAVPNAPNPSSHPPHNALHASPPLCASREHRPSAMLAGGIVCTARITRFRGWLSCCGRHASRPLWWSACIACRQIRHLTFFFSFSFQRGVRLAPKLRSHIGSC